MGCLAPRRVIKIVAKATAASAVHMEGLMVADRLEISMLMKTKSAVLWTGICSDLEGTHSVKDIHG